MMKLCNGMFKEMFTKSRAQIKNIVCDRIFESAIWGKCNDELFWLIERALITFINFSTIEPHIYIDTFPNDIETFNASLF